MGTAKADGWEGTDSIALRNAKRALIETIRARGVAPHVVEAIERVPREAFVPHALRHLAYADQPLPIAYEQTISQPSLVALMTDALGVGPGDVVLEIGSGSGYQAAILASLAKHVYTIELIEPLALAAAERLHRLGYANVDVMTGDGYEGWATHAPYDAICVTASSPDVPPSLIAQLAKGGRMVIPVGERLRLIVKNEQGQVSDRLLTWVQFVPLVHAGDDRDR
jgi:protein-L-isoaspartate(D-aspartate) O-methyltransferase